MVDMQKTIGEDWTCSLFRDMLVDKHKHTDGRLSQSSPNFVLVSYGRGSVLLWPHCDFLFTSVFVHDVTFFHNGPHGCCVSSYRQRRLNSITCTFIAACLKCRHGCLCGARCILFALVCRCRCHPEAPSSLASLKPRIFTQVVLEERHFVFSSSVKRPARPRQRCGLSPNYYGSFAVNSRALLFRTVRTFSPVAVSLDI